MTPATTTYGANSDSSIAEMQPLKNDRAGGQLLVSLVVTLLKIRDYECA